MRVHHVSTRRRNCRRREGTTHAAFKKFAASLAAFFVIAAAAPAAFGLDHVSDDKIALEVQAKLDDVRSELRSAGRLIREGVTRQTDRPRDSIGGRLGSERRAVATPRLELGRYSSTLKDLEDRAVELSAKNEFSARPHHPACRDRGTSPFAQIHAVNALRYEAGKLARSLRDELARWPLQSADAGAVPSAITIKADTGSISGTVIDSSSLTPIFDVRVRIYSDGGNLLTSDWTDASGNYEVTGLADGTYFASTHNDYGYVDELYDGFPCWSGCTATSGTPIQITGGAAISDVDFALEPGGRISGTVTDASTSGDLEGIDVDIYDSDGSYVTYGRTDASGIYTSLGGFPTGTYYARTWNTDGYVDELYDNLPCLGYCDETAGTPIPVTVGDTTTGIDFALEEGGRISGTVTDASTSDPLQWVDVDVYDSGGSYVTSGSTDASGDYISSSGLPAGTYYARTWNSAGYLDELYNDLPCWDSCDETTGTAITVTVGDTTTGIDFALARGGRIAGTVIDASSTAPIEDVEVDIYDSGGSYITYGWTDASGDYTSYKGLPGGTYYARTSNSLGYLNELYDDLPCEGSCTPTSGTPITVVTGSTTGGIDFALDVGGSVSGTVTDAATTDPLVHALVEVFDAGGSFMGSSWTDASGDYTVTGLPTGGYYARTSNWSGYLDELYDDIECWSGCTVTDGTPISVTAGSDTGGIDFALEPGGGVAGMVTDASSTDPIQDVEIDIYDSTGSYVAGVSTDASGDYEVSRLPSGTYYARTWNSMGYLDELYDDLPCWSGCDETTGTPISVTAGSTTGGIDFALEVGGSIAGTVTDDSTTDPIQDLAVNIYDDSGSYITYDLTDGSGHYEVSGLPTGTYHARTSSSLNYLDELYDDLPCWSGCDETTGTPISVTAGSTTSGIDFALAPGGTISGTVTDASTTDPVFDVRVRIYDSSGDSVDSDWTDASGNFTALGLPAGTYYARTSNALGYLDELYDNMPCWSGCTVTDGTPIVVTGGSTTGGIDFALAPGGRISGTVTDASSALPIENVEVDIYDAGGDWVTSGYTDASGNYATSGGFPAGTYYARTANSAGYLNELYDDLPCATGCTVTSGTPIVVTAGATTSGIDFALAKGGRISGTVTDASSALPIQSVGVDIYDGGGSWVTSGYTDSSGSFSSNTGLLAGTYYARTWNSSGYLDELYDNVPCWSGCTVTSGTPIVVTAGSTTGGIDFVLDAGGRISGIVTDASTAVPLQYVNVNLYDASGSYTTYDWTNSSGEYMTGAVPAGTYYARSVNWSGYADERHDDMSCSGSCDVVLGTPIVITTGVTITDIDFALYLEGDNPDLVLQKESVSSSTDFEACNSITAGPDFEIGSWANVSLRAGSIIVLTNGFSVESNADFTAWTDPTFICP